MSELYEIVEINPNDTVGGGGCVCSEVKDGDCEPPYAVFYGQEMENPLSPHVVICAGCLASASRACESEALAGGEPEIVEGVYEELPDEPNLSVEDKADLELVAAEAAIESGDIPEV